MKRCAVASARTLLVSTALARGLHQSSFCGCPSPLAGSPARCRARGSPRHPVTDHAKDLNLRMQQQPQNLIKLITQWQGRAFRAAMNIHSM